MIDEALQLTVGCRQPVTCSYLSLTMYAISGRQRASREPLVDGPLEPLEPLVDGHLIEHMMHGVTCSD